MWQVSATAVGVCYSHVADVCFKKNDAARAWIKEAGRVNHLKHCFLLNPFLMQMLLALTLVPPS